MANNYLQLSTSIENITPDEKTWIDNNIEKFDKELVECSKEDDNFDKDDYTSTFEWELEQDGSYLWIYGEEYANVESVADFMQAFLKENRPESSLYFSWAETCSKLRIDNFHGGAYFVTAKEQKCVSSFAFISKELDSSDRGWQTQ
jgi:hypothetical protein